MSVCYAKSSVHYRIFFVLVALAALLACVAGMKGAQKRLGRPDAACDKRRTWERLKMPPFATIPFHDEDGFVPM